MASITIIEVTKDYHNAFSRHAHNIARNLRQSDKDELSAVMNCAPDHDVMQGYEESEQKWIIIDYQGTIAIPIVLFGVQRFDDNIGVPWMVATEDITKIKKFLAENTQQYIDIMLAKYEILINYVDARNTVSIEWLKHVGFTLEEAKPYGVNGLPFHRFYMEREK